MIARLAKEIPSDKRIMITFGGGSVKKNGVYDQVKEALEGGATFLQLREKELDEKQFLWLY